MQLFRLSQPRQPLVKFVATQTYQNIQQSQMSAFEYLCQICLVIIDASSTEYIFHNSEHGCIATLNSEDEDLAINALAHLLMRHYMVEQPSSATRQIFRDEADLFIQYYTAEKSKECSNSKETITVSEPVSVLL